MRRLSHLLLKEKAFGAMQPRSENAEQAEAFSETKKRKTLSKSKCFSQNALRRSPARSPHGEWIKTPSANEEIEVERPGHRTIGKLCDRWGSRYG